MMWTFFEATQDPFWREQAEATTRRVDQVWRSATRAGTGFMAWFGGLRRWYEVSVRENLAEAMVRQRLMTLGTELSRRFVYPLSGTPINDPGRPPVDVLLGIDDVLEMPLVLFAAAETSDPQLAETAARHCAAIRRCMVRGDGSVADQAIIDARTGRLRRWVGCRALRADSCWSCGLAWSILGFATAGRMMDFEPWLETARRCANYLIERLSASPVPPWDFEAQPEGASVEDGAAGAVAAVALFALADAAHRVGTDDARYRQRLRETAFRILDALCQPEYLAVEDPNWEGLLKHAVGNLPCRWAVDESVVWGDAFLVEGLHQAIQLLKNKA